MPEFILNDDGGAVVPWQGHRPLHFAELSDFVQGYIEALFFTESAPGITVTEWQATNDHAEGSFPGECGYSDLAGPTLRKIMRDCQRFQIQGAILLQRAFARDYDERQAGRDFWFTRNGHGVGFWDRDELKEDDDSAEYERLTSEMVANVHNRDIWDAALTKRNALEAESLSAMLTAFANQFGEVWVYLGDDNKIRGG